MSTVLNFGAETRVNTYTTNAQTLPAMTTLTGGDYVVTWSSNGQDGASYGIYAQRFTAAGVAVGVETQVSTVASYNLYYPEVVALSDGGYVVAWTSNSQDTSDGGIYLQRYNASGIAIGGETQVNTTTAGDQYRPSMAPLPDGGFIVTWTSANQDGAGYGVYAQRFDAAGSPTGTEFRVNTTTTLDQSEPSITSFADGGFIIAWQSSNQDGSGLGVYAQRYDADGSSSNGEVRINSTTTSDQHNPSITTLSDGGYVVVWTSYQTGYSEIFSQRFDAADMPVGGETKVSSLQSSVYPYSYEPNVAALPNGQYIVTWSAGNGYDYDILAARFDSSGTKLGEQFVVSATRYETGPVVTGFADGSFSIAWQSRVQSDSDIVSRFFSAQSLTAMSSATELVYGTSANDTLLADPGALGPGDQIDGLGGSDTIQLNAPGILDITAPTAVRNIEALTGSSGNDTFVVSQSRLAGLTSIDGGQGVDTIRNTMADSQFDLSGQTLTSIERIEGRAGTNNITLTGMQAAGLTAIAGGSSFDTLSIKSGGTFDISGITITGVEYFYGSSGNDTLAFAPGQLSGFQFIDLGAGIDTLQFKTAGTLDLTSMPQINGLEIVAGSSGDDTIVVNSARLGLTTIDGGGGTDSLLLNDSLSLQNITVTNVERIIGVSGSTYSISAANISNVTLLDGGGNSSLNLDLSALNGATVLDLGNSVQNGVVGTTTIRGFAAGYLSGGSGDDSFTGGNSSDVLLGGIGNDTLDGGAGSDSLLGGAGNDVLKSLTAPGAGQEYLDGGGDFDFAIVNRSASGRNLSLDLGDPTLMTALGDNTFIVDIERIDFTAGSGNDILSGGAFDDILTGNAGRDTLDGRGGNDLLYGGSGIDLLTGGDGSDSLYGGDSNDILDGEDGDDFLDGGAGNDDLSGGAGNDYMLGGADADRLSGGDGRDRLSGGAGVDTLYGGDGFDLLYGEAGSDTLDGDTGNDLLDGGSGVDVMTGGLGDDFYIVDDVRDQVIESDDEGYDGIFSSVSYTAGIGVEQLSLTGAANLNGYGNELDNAIQGNTGNNTLYGYAGNDLLEGGAGVDLMYGGDGSDIYYVENSADRIYDTAATGYDTVNTSVAFQLAAGQRIELLQITSRAGTDTINLIGNEFANTLNGNNGINALRGNGGDDIISGFDGSDSLFGGAGNDVMIGGAERDFLYGEAGADTFRFATGDTGLTATTFDVITDFSSSIGDRIDLNISVSAAAYDERTVSSDAFGTALNAATAAMSDGQHQAVFVAGSTVGWLFWNTDDNATTVEHAVRLNGVNNLNLFGQFDLI